MAGKLPLTPEEIAKFLELGKGITEKNSFFPKDEWHHSNTSGKGPANTPIIRHGHEMIHGDIADVLKKYDYPVTGFCGDATTRKFGNEFFGKKEEPLDYIDALTKKAQENIDIYNWNKDLSPKYPSLEEKPFNPIGSWPSTLNDPKPALPKFNWEKYLKDQEPTIIPITEKPKNYFGLKIEKKMDEILAISEIIEKEKKEKEATERIITHIKMMKSINATLSTPKKPKYYNHVLPKIDLEPTLNYKATQEHWTWKNPVSQDNDSWKPTIVPTLPTLKPRFDFKDPYLTQNDAGNSILDKIIERNNAERIASYKGSGSAEHIVLEKGRLDSLNFTPGSNNLLTPPLDTGGWGT